MTDRRHESGSPLVAADTPRRLAERRVTVADWTPGDMPAAVPAIGFSLLGLASRIEHVPASTAGER